MMSEAKEEMKLTREDEILLMFGEKRKHLNFSKIAGNKKENECAVIQLRNAGYVTVHENGSSRYDRFITISITDNGIIRKNEIERLVNRTTLEKGRDAVTDSWRFVRPSFGRIIEEVIKALVLLGIGILIGARLP